MAINTASLVGCVAYLYDTLGMPLAATRVSGYDPRRKEIEIEPCPQLDGGQSCRMLVLTAPSPSEFMGTLRRYVAPPSTVLAVYSGQVKESREATRFKVNSPALIDTIIRGGLAYALQPPLPIRLVNLSKGGLRLSAGADTLLIGDCFDMRLAMGESEENLSAEVLHDFGGDGVHSEYGCRFIERPQRPV